MEREDPGGDREGHADLADLEGLEAEPPSGGTVVLTVTVRGKRPVAHLIARLSEIAGMVSVGIVHGEADAE